MMLQHALQRVYERLLCSQYRYIPQHIAIIQDGNRRFARSQGISTADGHRAGADTTEQMLEWARELGIRHITLYCFSTENFSRDQKEVQELITLFNEKLHQTIRDPRTHAHRIRIQMLGDRSLLPPDLLATVEEAERLTASYEGYFIHLALAYGGRNEIVQAAKEILRKVQDGVIGPDAIDSSLVERYLDGGAKIPPVDLIIRTGNEQRTSNFLPWRANGNECAVYFCAPNWPSFRKIDLLRAIRVYDQRIQQKMGESGV